MKYRLYVDEVGNSDLGASHDPNHRYLSLTGVILELGYVDRTVFPAVEELKRTYFGSHPDDPVVFHRKALVNRKHPFEALREAATERAFSGELEQLAQEVVALIQESRRPLAETLADAAKERSPALAPEVARQIAEAIVAKADDMLFPGWPDQEHIDTELFREFTKLLAKEFPAAGLHRRDQDFVDRCIKMLRRANYRARADG